MVATSGDRLLAPDAIDVLKRELLPRALVITPNLPEAAALLDAPVARNEAEMRAQAERLLALGAKAVLIKGGHGNGAGERRSPGRRATRMTRLARRPRRHAATPTAPAARCRRRSRPASPRAMTLAEATCAPPRLTSRRRSSPRTGCQIGSGHGPVHHFHAWW